MKKQNWTCTDPDNYQYGRKISENVYEFKELSRNHDFKITDKWVNSVFDNGGFWKQDVIDLNDYVEPQKENYISGYYPSMEELKRICKNDIEQVNWIIAECIFEQTN